MKSLRVHYVGDDPEFIKCIQGRIEALKLAVAFSYSMDNLMSLVAKFVPAVIYVDFTANLDYQICLEEIIYLKKIPRFKPILFVGLLKDEDQLKSLDHIFTSGIQLSFIKGGEYESLFRDSLYIAADERVSYPQYALAEGLYQKTQAGLCSSITEISSSGLTLETDIEFRQSQIALSQKICPGVITIDVVSDQEVATLYPLLTSYDLNFPVSDGWTDDQETSIRPETIETWQELHQDHFLGKKEQLFVIEPTFAHIKEAFELGRHPKIGTFYFEKSEEALKLISNKLPSLIFIEVDVEDEKPNSMNMVEQVIREVRSQRSYHPVIILSNVASSSSAVQKFMDYNYIVCYSGKIYENLITTFSDLYSKKKTTKVSSFSKMLSPHSNFRSADVNFEIIVRKMTENYVVFRCEEELPMFSVLHFYNPTEFYATLVPTNEKNPEAKIYTAIIHGVTETKLELMRQFINALIANPDLEFKIQDTQLLETGSHEKEEDIVVKSSDAQKINEYREETKPRYTGKSKL